MLNRLQKLNTKLFDQDVEQVSTRAGFGEGLLAAAEADPRVVGLCADLKDSTQMLPFAKKFPERFVEVGVAEQNLVTVASGMAAMGKIPFASSYAIFNPGRNWEQIRTTICYNDRPVKIVGSHAGLNVGSDGGSHQALEDIALMRVLPRMIVLSPCDAIEAKKATIAAAKTNTPVYIRLAREKSPIITTEQSPFEIGKAQVVFEPIAGKPDVVLIATGPLLHQALVAARDLEKEHIGVTVINLSTIKPLDEKTLIRAAREAGAAVCVEEHQIAGGMGGAVAECLAQNHPVPQEFVGVHDVFGQSGTAGQLLEKYGLAVDAIKSAAKKAVKRKMTI